MKYIFHLFFVYFICVCTKVFAIENTPQHHYTDSTTVISMLTCGPADSGAVWTRWGHTAIRVQNPAKGMDMVFNYGTFDNSTPGFISKFIKGSAQYFLNIEDFNTFQLEYIAEKRYIIQQTLNLDQQEKDSLLVTLIENAKPENKYYQYDFAFNNCCTKPRDLLAPYGLIAKKMSDDEPSFRSMIDDYLKKDEWWDFGIDILFGLPMDKKADSWNQYFLPEYIMKGVDDSPGLIRSKETILQAYPVKKHWVPGPALVFWILLFIVIFFYIRKKDTSDFNRIFPIIILLIYGLIGIFLSFMWFGTDHVCTKWNLNTIWACPFSFVLAIVLFKKKLHKWVYDYIFIYRMILILLLFIWPFFPQRFHTGVFPLILLEIMVLSTLLPLKKRYFLNA